MRVGVVLKTEKHETVLETGSYEIGYNTLVLKNPEGNILASMSFLKKNLFEISIEGVTYHDCEFVEMKGSLEQAELFFSFKTISRKDLANVS